MQLSDNGPLNLYYYQTKFEIEFFFYKNNILVWFNKSVYDFQFILNTNYLFKWLKYWKKVYCQYWFSMFFISFFTIVFDRIRIFFFLSLNVLFVCQKWSFSYTSSWFAFVVVVVLFFSRAVFREESCGELIIISRFYFNIQLLYSYNVLYV